MLTWLYLKYQINLLKLYCWVYWCGRYADSTGTGFYVITGDGKYAGRCRPKDFPPGCGENKSGNLSRYMVPVVALVSLYFIFNGNDTLVAIMLLGVNIIAQFFPALIFSFAKRIQSRLRALFRGLWSVSLFWRSPMSIIFQ